MKDILLVLPFKASSPLIGWTADAYSDVEGVEIVGTDEGRETLVFYSDIEFNIPGILNRVCAG